MNKSYSSGSCGGGQEDKSQGKFIKNESLVNSLKNMKNLANENFPVPRFMAWRRWGKTASYGLLVYLMVVGGREGEGSPLTCVWPRLKDI